MLRWRSAELNDLTAPFWSPCGGWPALVAAAADDDGSSPIALTVAPRLSPTLAALKAAMMSAELNFLTLPLKSSAWCSVEPRAPCGSSRCIAEEAAVVKVLADAPRVVPAIRESQQACFTCAVFYCASLAKSCAISFHSNHKRPLPLLQSQHMTCMCIAYDKRRHDRATRKVQRQPGASARDTATRSRPAIAKAHHGCVRG